jgi:drug/metabolite transporter (DMT)-like permease
VRQWLGFGLGLAGVALVVGLKLGDAVQAGGMAIGGVAVLCFVAGTLYYARYCRNVGLVLANMVQLGSAAAVCWILTALFEVPRADWTPAAVVTLLHLTIAVSLGGMALLLFMLRTGTAGKVAANFYLTPGLTALLGWVILGEDLGTGAIAGFAVASAGVWLVNRG